VRGQTDERAWADASNSPRESRFQRQARRSSSRLFGNCPRTETCIGYLHRKWREGTNGVASGRGSRSDAGKIRGMPRSVPRVQLVSMDHGNLSTKTWATTERARARTETERWEGSASKGCHRSLEGVRALSASRRRDSNSG